jgi:hypothetical protein
MIFYRMQVIFVIKGAYIDSVIGYLLMNIGENLLCVVSNN